MPPTGYKDKPSADTTDFNGIIGAMCNCTWMQKYFTDDLSQNTNICTKARDAVNSLRHIHDTNIDDGFMTSFFDCLLNLLRDPAHLNSFQPAVDARTYLTQLQQGTLPLSQITVNDTLTKLYEEQREGELYEKQKEEFRGRLISLYTTTKTTLSISPLWEGHDKPIWDIFVSPKLSHVTIAKDGSRENTGNEIHQYDEIFFKDEKLRSRVFVQGEPGMGKTAFLNKLALDWCEAISLHTSDHNGTFSDVNILKEFQFLFSITLKNAIGQREVNEMIETQIIDMIYSKDEREDGIKLLQKIMQRETCLVTMDGLNEWTDHLNKHVVPLMTMCHTKCVLLVTTRPWRMADERIKDSEIDILLEIEGVNDPEELTKHILHILKTDNEKTHIEFMTYVKERKLMQFLTSPWLQTLLVNLWINKNTFIGSLCEIYCILLDLLFKKATKAKEGYFQKGKSLQCLSNTHFIKHQIDIFEALSKAAFNFTLTSDKSLVFTERELINYLNEEQLKFCLEAGVLTKRCRSAISEQDSQFSFMHETIQMFFAAYYIASSKEDMFLTNVIIMFKK